MCREVYCVARTGLSVSACGEVLLGEGQQLTPMIYAILLYAWFVSWSQSNKL